MKERNEQNIAINIVQFIFGLILLVMILFSFVGCGTIKEIPVQTIEKIEYRDSLIFIRDSIFVEIPIEKIVQVLPTDTTSQISTSLAHSEAKVEKGILTHTLEQKGQIKTKIDTVVKVQYVDRIVEKELPIEVQVEKRYIPDFFWYSIIFNIIVLLYLVFKIYLKFKGVSLK